ncbi:MAG: hypothetical protein J6Y89_01490, partial [Lachnospiraceae bacterium]|nr:hypothetical protein [Lachnospiraceae bacterium]
SPFIVWDTKKWLVEYLRSQPQGSWLGIATAADEEEVKVDDDSFLASLFEWKFGKDDKDLLNILGVEVTSGTAAAFLGRLQTEDFKGYLLKGYVSSKDKTKTSYDIKDAKDAFEDWAKNKDLYDEFKDVSYYDKDGNKLSQQQGKDVNFMKRQATLYEWEKKVSAGVSVFDGEWDTKIGKVSAKVGDAEAHASISGGFYVVGADGKKKFSPGVKAEIGASATALEIGLENDAIIGNEMLGINGDAKLTLGKIGAKGTATAQIYGEDGKLDLQLDAGVKAEATLAEVEGSLGVNVLGGEVKAKATGSIGIGAHANVGYKDGVIKLDIGASLGIGGSVSLEADIGGMVDTVVSTGKAVVDGIGKAASGVASFVGKAFSWFG